MPETFNDERHRALFGPDANNLRHGIVQQRITSYMAERLDLPHGDQEFLAALALYHDLGECKAAGSKTGDKDWSLKDALDEEDERSVLEKILDADPHFAKLAPIRARILMTMADAKSERPQTLEGLLFDASERVGYVRTVMAVHSKTPNWAVDLALPSPSPFLDRMLPHERATLQFLFMEVIGRHTTDLHRRHVAETTGHSELDGLVEAMIAENAHRLLPIVEPLTGREYLWRFHDFQHEKFTTNLRQRKPMLGELEIHNQGVDHANLYQANFRNAVEVLRNYVK